MTPDNPLSPLGDDISTDVYRLLAEHATDMIALHTPDGRYLYVNPAYERLTGFTRRELLALTVEDLPGLIHPEDRQRTRGQALLQVQGGEAVTRVQYRHRCKDGTYRWVEAFAAPIVDEAGQVVQIVSSIRDIAERKQVEAELRRDEANFRLVLRESLIVFARVDRDLRYTWVHNPHPDFDSALVIGKRDDELADNDGVRQLMALKRRVFASGEPEQAEITFPLSDGEHTYSIQAMPLLDSSGEISEVTTVAIDITRRKQEEQHTLQLRFEQERWRLLRSFIEKAAHEFKTPLTAINAALYFLLRADTLEKQQQRAGQIEGQVKRISRLVDMLLQTAELGSGLEGIAPVNIARLLAALCEDERFPASAVTLHCDIPPDLPPIQGSEEYLHQAFAHILDNALRYTPAGGRVTVRAAVQMGHIVVQVLDTGSGIASEDLPHIFEAFWRKDEAHSTPGLGLGLAITARIVDVHQGLIHVASEPGAGTTVTVNLPLPRS